MQFRDIIGQEELKRRLVASVAAGRVSHAQLFTGAAGAGTLPLAVAYAQYLNCRHRADGDSCGVCPDCRQIAALAHPDLHLVFPVNKQGKKSGEVITSDAFLPLFRTVFARSNGYFSPQEWYDALDLGKTLRGAISAREADEIIRKLSFKSFESEYKIVVVWLAERMNTQAANKLLKILEEPWDKTLFLLLSASPEQLLPTIVSRTQCVTVPSIDETSLTRYLTARKGMPEADAFRAARLSRGDLLEALRYLRHASENDELFDLFVKLMRLSYEDRHLELLEWAETVASMGREEQKRLIENSVRLLRDSYMLTAGMEPICYLFGREEQFCKKFAPYVNNRNIEPLVAEMERTMRQIAQNGNPRIVFPHFALTVSKLINRL